MAGAFHSEPPPPSSEAAAYLGLSVTALHKLTTPLVTMTTYARAIDEADDDAVRRARVDAMCASSNVAARDGRTPPQTGAQPNG